MESKEKTMVLERAYGKGQLAQGQLADLSNLVVPVPILNEQPPTSSQFSNATASAATESDNTTNKSKPLPSASFRPGRFTKSLMMKAQSDSSCMSPSTLQSLVSRVNPMRYNFPNSGAAGVSNTNASPDKDSEPPVCQVNVDLDSNKRAGEELRPSPQDENRLPLTEEKNDSGVDSNSNSGHEEDHQKNQLMNTSFSEMDDDFNALNINDKPKTMRTTAPAPYVTERKKVKPAYFNEAAGDTGEIISSAMAAPNHNNNEIRRDPSSATYNFHKPTPLQSLGSSARNISTPKNSYGRGSENNNSNNIPEVAARIPASSTQDGRKVGTPMNNGRVKGSGNHLSASGKQKSLSSLKEKKPNAGTGSGWKFSSEHVQGREYLIIKQLGKGGCGEVALVIEKETRQLFALKRVNLSGIGDASIEECINEVEMLVALKDSDLVVHIHSWEFNRSEKTMKIVMEHGQCDLNSSIKTLNFTELKLKFTWERILMIVETIHKRGIVHADIKPANFIWVGDNLKIIDFGIASKLQNDHTSIAMLNPKGTLNFISPETLQPDHSGRSKISPKSDIWSLGCILYLMVYGKTPFEHVNHPINKMQAICKGEIEYPQLPLIFQSSATELLSVLRSCFQMDYRKRPSTSDLLSHPFLRTVSSTRLNTS